MQQVNYTDYLKETYECLTSGGLFLNTRGDKDNSMVIGWGGVNVYWGKPVFIVPVRYSRFTHDQLEKNPCFTVSVPMGVDLKKALGFCGSKSGRDYDKFKECGLTSQNASTVDAPIIGECTLHYECKVVYKQDMDPAKLDKQIDESMYSDKDYHTMYYGEITACYTTP